MNTTSQGQGRFDRTSGLGASRSCDHSPPSASTQQAFTPSVTRPWEDFRAGSSARRCSVAGTCRLRLQPRTGTRYCAVPGPKSLPVSVAARAPIGRHVLWGWKRSTTRSGEWHLKGFSRRTVLVDLLRRIDRPLNPVSVPARADDSQIPGPQEEPHHLHFSPTVQLETGAPASEPGAWVL